MTALAYLHMTSCCRINYRPLASRQEVEERLQVVDLFRHHPHIRQQFQAGLAGLPDLPRLMARAAAMLTSCTTQPDEVTPDEATWLAAVRRQELAGLQQTLAGLLAALEVTHTLHEVCVCV
jgi:hypothetical protein